MADRTCKPDADFKRLWRTLLPGTPFPACGTTEEFDATPAGDIETAKSPRDAAEPNRDLGAIRR
jgi:hypothetical protein